MHTWGKLYSDNGLITDINGNKYSWTKIETDDNGNNDAVYLTALIQELKLSKNESPFYASRGIAARDSVMSQIYPDYDASLIQQRYSSYFSSIVIARDTTETEPVYKVSVITHSGAVISSTVAV